MFDDSMGFKIKISQNHRILQPWSWLQLQRNFNLAT
jgi:hypothetical protein